MGPLIPQGFINPDLNLFLPLSSGLALGLCLSRLDFHLLASWQACFMDMTS